MSRGGCGCDYCMGGVVRNDFRRDTSGGYEETPYRKAGKNKRKKKPRAGCPGNDGKAHVYVWVEEKFIYTHPWSQVPKPKVQTIKKQICCGCGKIKNRKFVSSRDATSKDLATIKRKSDINDWWWL